MLWRRRNITTHHTSVALRLMNDCDTSTSHTPQLCVFRGRASGDESRSQGAANPLVPPQLRVCKTHLERFFTVLSLECMNLSLLRLNGFYHAPGPLYMMESVHILNRSSGYFFFFWQSQESRVVFHSSLSCVVSQHLDQLHTFQFGAQWRHKTLQNLSFQGQVGKRDVQELLVIIEAILVFVQKDQCC